ncbi:hypothetical protein J6590_067440 [Homalodisca vitripennis]|nr:hypothetical protein J6590_067440 [Homalodisca vitripennis]
MSDKKDTRRILQLHRELEMWEGIFIVDERTKTEGQGTNIRPVTTIRGNKRAR